METAALNEHRHVEPEKCRCWCRSEGQGSRPLSEQKTNAAREPSSRDRSCSNVGGRPKKSARRPGYHRHRKGSVPLRERKSQRLQTLGGLASKSCAPGTPFVGKECKGKFTARQSSSGRINVLRKNGCTRVARTASDKARKTRKLSAAG